MWYMAEDDDLYNLSLAYRIEIKECHKGFYLEAVFMDGNGDYIAPILNTHKTRTEALEELRDLQRGLNR